MSAPKIQAGKPRMTSAQWRALFNSDRPLCEVLLGQEADAFREQLRAKLLAGIVAPTDVQRAAADADSLKARQKYFDDAIRHIEAEAAATARVNAGLQKLRGKQDQTDASTEASKDKDEGDGAPRAVPPPPVPAKPRTLHRVAEVRELIRKTLEEEATAYGESAPSEEPPGGTSTAWALDVPSLNEILTISDGYISTLTLGGSEVAKGSPSRATFLWRVRPALVKVVLQPDRKGPGIDVSLLRGRLLEATKGAVAVLVVAADGFVTSDVATVTQWFRAAGVPILDEMSPAAELDRQTAYMLSEVRGARLFLDHVHKRLAESRALLETLDQQIHEETLEAAKAAPRGPEDAIGDFERRTQEELSDHLTFLLEELHQDSLTTMNRFAAYLKLRGERILTPPLAPDAKHLANAERDKTKETFRIADSEVTIAVDHVFYEDNVKNDGSGADPFQKLATGASSNLTDFVRERIAKNLLPHYLASARVALLHEQVEALWASVPFEQPYSQSAVKTTLEARKTALVKTIHEQDAQFPISKSLWPPNFGLLLKGLSDSLRAIFAPFAGVFMALMLFNVSGQSEIKKLINVDVAWSLFILIPPLILFILYHLYSLRQEQMEQSSKRARDLVNAHLQKQMTQFESEFAKLLRDNTATELDDWFRRLKQALNPIIEPQIEPLGERGKQLKQRADRIAAAIARHGEASKAAQESMRDLDKLLSKLTPKAIREVPE